MAENKFYHFADGHPISYSAYTRPTSGLTCWNTCNCDINYSASTYSASTCNKVYPITGITNPDKDVLFTEPNPLYDSVSNALSIQLSGNSGNPIVCVKTYTLTGTCETSGATVNQWCSTKGIFDQFKNTDFIQKENWVQIDAVFVRDRLIENCDLKEFGGLGLLIDKQFTASTANRSVELILPNKSLADQEAEINESDNNTEVFINQHGEKMTMVYDPETGSIKIQHDDINGNFYPLMQFIEKFNLNNEEKKSILDFYKSKSNTNEMDTKKEDELSDKDKAMVDDYEEEEANREVPRDYASMYEAEGDGMSATDQMLQQLIAMAEKGEFDNDQIRDLGQQLTSARKRYFTAQRSPESYKAAAEKAKATKAQQKIDYDASEKEREKEFNSPLDIPIDPSNRDKFKDEAERIRRVRGQLPWNVSSSDRTPNPKYYDLVGTDDETGVKQYKLKGEWKGKVVTDYNDLNPNTGEYQPLSTKDDDIFINEARWAKLSGLDK